jgi:hypothetical protein
MERTFTIFREKVKYEQNRDKYHLLFNSGKIYKTLSREEFIANLSVNLGVQLTWCPRKTWEEITKHTCRNKEMKKRLEKYLTKALEIHQAGGLKTYKKNLKVKASQVILKHWNFPTDLERIVYEFI